MGAEKTPNNNIIANSVSDEKRENDERGKKKLYNITIKTINIPLDIVQYE
jgi:hypothetical protein